MTTRREIRIGMAGLGTVGQGVWKHLRSRRKELEARVGSRLSIERIAVRDLGKKRKVRLPARILTDDPETLVRDSELDLFCELMGGTKDALKLTKAALKAGKTVVTANKALLCHHGEQLFRLAKENNAHIYFEASVAGGIPIIKALREGLVVNRFPLIYGILNGTCNYILTRMEREGRSFEDILGDARRLGYVEADEALDLDGIDAAHKAVIITYLAHGKWIPLKQMPVEGIRDITLEDIEWARKLGFKIKLLALILHDAGRQHVFASVQPALVPSEMILANVDGVYNAVSVTGDIVGESVYIGKGAGQDATASAVLSDLVDAGTAITHGIRPEEPRINEGLQLAPLKDVLRSFYIRLSVKDQPGVLAEVANILASENISIESVLQRPNGKRGSANLILTTHICSEASMAAAVKSLRRHSSLLHKPFLLRIADFAQRLG